MDVLEPIVKTFVPQRKLTVEHQIEILKNSVNSTQKTGLELDKKSSNQQKRNLDQIAIESKRLARMWIEYIKGCRNRIDLYEYALENSIGNFNSEFVISFA